MKAVILAAGEGKRLRPFTETMPKVMLPIANKPILEYVIDAIKKCGIHDIIIVVGYKKEAIMEYFKKYDKDVKITYVIQDKQLGTAHALLQTKKYVKNPFIVVPGDNIIDQKSINRLVQDKSEYCLLIKEHTHTSKYGVVFSEEHVLKKIVEKPKDEISKYISTGIYKLQPDIFETLKELTDEGVYILTAAIQSLINNGKKIRSVLAHSWRDIVYPWDLVQVNEAFMHTIPTTIGGTIEKGVTIKGPVNIGKDSTIYAGCYIQGPVIIGEGCEIGPNVCIFPSTAIGDNVVIHPFCELRNSVIMNNVRINSNGYLTNSVIARGSSIGNNFSCTLGKTTIEIEGEFKTVENIGVMLGEDSTLGNNIVTESGNIIGNKCEIGSLLKITKRIPSHSKVM